MSKAIEVGSIIEGANLAELYPTRFMHAIDFKGKPVTLTIARKPWREGLRGQAVNEVNVKVVLTFKETDKQLVLAKINSHAIGVMFGTDVAGWEGKRVTFFPTADLMPKDRGVPCIRVFGSPMIDRPMVCTFKAPQRRDTVWTLQPTGRQQQQQLAPQPQPEQPQPAPTEDAAPFDPKGEP